MRTERQLVRYNAWANRRVFDLCASVETERLRETDGGSLGSIEQTLKHMVGVEDVYLEMLRGREPGGGGGSREEYFAHDVPWFRARSEEVADGYEALLDGRDEAWLEGTMRVPWFDFPMTLRDGLLQALMHSAQHRAQVFSVLGAQGVAVPDVDYVLMVGEKGGTG